MKLPETFYRLLRTPTLTWPRIVLALFVAVAGDGLQWLLGPVGWAFGAQIIDVIVMFLTSWLIGFHWLLLPSFVLELIPLTDEFPTWTACVITVTVLRRREQRASKPLAPEEPTIEI